MRDLKEEISLELLNYSRKFGKRGKVLLLGEEEWDMLHDEENPLFKPDFDGVEYNDSGYADNVWSLYVYRTHDKSLIRVGGRE